MGQAYQCPSSFPLRYHRDIVKVKADLVQCGRKFVSLRGSHHCHCHSRAFFIKEGKPVRVPVDSRVLINAAFFEEINPNNSRPRVNEPGQMPWAPLVSSASSNGPSRRQVKSISIEPADLQEDELLICCPTVPGLSLGNKL